MKKFLLALVGTAFCVSGAVAADPVFPESFQIVLSAKGLKAKQYIEQDVYTISISGTCPQEEYSVTLGVPEGWDGFIGMTDVGYIPDIEPLKFKAFDPEWVPISVMEKSDKLMMRGNKLTFPADGDDHMGMLYLYKGDEVDIANQIRIETVVEQKEDEPEPEPLFPSTFDVVMSCEGPTLSVNGPYITVTGECDLAEVTLTVQVPEGWDGFIGMTDVGYVPDVQPFFTKAGAIHEWQPIDEMLKFGMKKGNTLTFPVDGEEHIGQLYLYKGDLVENADYISVEFDVKKADKTSVDTLGADECNSRYFDLNGAEVLNPAGGIYLKASGNKVSKVLVK